MAGTAMRYLPVSLGTFPEVDMHNLLYALICSALVLNLVRKVQKGYQRFIALGPGGTPSTFPGYLRVCYLQLYAHKDPFQPPSLAQACSPDQGYLQILGRRSRPRPQTDGIAPHRQLDQRCSLYIYERLRIELHMLADEHPRLLQKGNSCFEKHGLALFLSPYSGSSRSPFKHLNPTCENTGEICHLHASVSAT